jgi:peptidoglycan biosynthesis protein MviN/MurJ (putative lipid II flippase)
MYVSFMAVGLNLIFNWIFTFHLGWGVQGLALSTGCVATCNFLVLYALMRRHLRGLDTRLMGALLLKVAVATGALVAVCLASMHWLLGGWATESLLQKLGELLLTVSVAMAVYGGAAHALHVDELHRFSAALRRRLGV